MNSSEIYRKLKGIQDILPPDTYLWQNVEQTARQIFSVYGFQEIRIPVIEMTNVFVRSIGEDTDIVAKEMYTFVDKGGRNITLRPEGTASVVRSYVENHLYNLPSPQKFYYMGPMFRYERPQAGRYRQFYQIGVEAFASPHPEMDAEILLMLRNFLTAIELKSIKFQINSIGCEICRPVYREKLLKFFLEKKGVLCTDCNRRYDTNPLRILDCKVNNCIQARKGAPLITDYICNNCRSHFEKLQSILDYLGVKYILNPEMVRGLDYYTRTTFEVTNEHLGAQNAVAAGGRYDRLVREFGGPDTPAIGFAIGIERLIELIKNSSSPSHPVPDVFIVTLGDRAVTTGIYVAERLRSKGFWAETGNATHSIKSQLRKADRMSSKYVFIIGEDEIDSGRLKWKNLSDSSQGEIEIEDAEVFFKQNI